MLSYYEVCVKKEDFCISQNMSGEIHCYFQRWSNFLHLYSVNNKRERIKSDMVKPSENACINAWFIQPQKSICSQFWKYLTENCVTFDAL